MCNEKLQKTQKYAVRFKELQNMQKYALEFAWTYKKTCKCI